MLTLYFVRHAETPCSLADTYCGHCRASLTPRGLEQAAALARAYGERFPWQALYTSPLPRARQTAEILARASGHELRMEEGLAELHYGSWDGKTPSELHRDEPDSYAAWLQDPARHAPPGGETAEAVASRVERSIERIRREHGDGKVLAVSHKAAIRILLCRLLGLPVGLYRARIGQPLAAVNIIEFRETGPLLVRLGDTSHL